MEELICELSRISPSASKDEIRRAVMPTLVDAVPQGSVARLLFYRILKIAQILSPEEAWGITNDRDERGNIKISTKCWWCDAHYHMNFVGRSDPYSIYRIDEYWNGARLEWVRFHFNALNPEERMTVVTYHSSGRVKIDNLSIRAVYNNGIFSLVMPTCRVGDQYVPAFVFVSEDDISVQFERTDATIALFRKHQED